MTATEVLRRLLDERGVEWTAPNSILRDTMTCWTAGGFYYEAFEVPEPDGTFLLTAAHQDELTPEQAIAVTLGSSNCSDNCTNGERTNGTCHPIISDNLNESEGMGDAWADCSECGHLLFVLTDPNSEPPKFCPNCGRRVEQ